MSFRFIDNESIDRRTRRVIRSHVAKGRNLGKTLHRRRARTKVHGQAYGTLATSTSVITSAAERANVSAEQAMPSDISTVPASERLLSRSTATSPITTGPSLISFPLDLSSQSRRSLEKFLSTIYEPVEYRASIVFEACRTTWIQYLFHDEAYFHCNVAISLVMDGGVVARSLPDVNREVLRRAANAYHMVTDRLSGDDALFDSTLAVVMALVHFECLGGRYQQGLLHFQGLQKLVHLRGGISRLRNSCPDIAHKVFRSDLELALLLGTEVWCPVEEVPGQGVLVDMRQELPQDFCRADRPPYRQVTPALNEILLDMLSLACRLNAASRGPGKPTDYCFHQILVLLGHRLINLSTFMYSTLDGEYDRYLHLGLSTFVATFFVGPTHKISDFKLLAGVLREAAEASLSKDEANMEIILWALSLARADMFDEVGDDWLIQTMKSLILYLGIQYQEEFERMLRKYPWVDILHSESAQKIWSDVCQHTCEIAKSPTNDV